MAVDKLEVKLEGGDGLLEVAGRTGSGFSWFLEGGVGLFEVLGKDGSGFSSFLGRFAASRSSDMADVVIPRAMRRATISSFVVGAGLIGGLGPMSGSLRVDGDSSGSPGSLSRFLCLAGSAECLADD